MTGSTRLGRLWLGCTGVIARAGGEDDVDVVERAHALLSDHAVGLIFVLSLDRTASAISIPESFQMRPTHGVPPG